MRSVLSNGIVVGALVLCAPACAQVTLPSTTFAGARSNEGARAMVYWRVQLDGARSHAPQYGLRLDSAPVRLGAQLRPLPIAEFVFGGGRTTVKTLGAIAFDSSDLGTTESLTNGWFWVGTGLAVLAISCATRNFPCKDDDKSSGPSTPIGDGR